MLKIKGYNDNLDWLETDERLIDGVSLQHQWRVGWPGDYIKVRKMFRDSGYKVSPHKWMLHISNAGFQARGAYRNQFYPVLVYLSSHGPKWNTLSAIGVNKNRCDGSNPRWYYGHLLAMSTMLQHVRHELPELPTRVIIPHKSLPIIREFPVECGMHEIDRDDKRSVWAIRQLYDRSRYVNSIPSNTPDEGNRAPCRSFDDGGGLTAISNGLPAESPRQV